MASVVMAIISGYVYGIFSQVKKIPIIPFENDRSLQKIFYLSQAISVGALFFIILNAILFGNFNTDVSQIGEAYTSSYEGYERNTGNYSLEFIIYSISLPFNFIYMVLGLFYFNSLNKPKKAILIIFLMMTLFFYVLGSGKQKQIGDVIIFMFSVAAVKYGIRRKSIGLKFLIGGALAVSCAIMAFVAVLGQRYSALGIDIININRRVSDRIFFDTGHPIFSIFGFDYGLNLSFFLSYLSQGYYGLGLALETDWQWTHFLGFSYSLSVLANRFLGLEWEWPNTLLYQVGLTTGWGESKWHTVFTHFATDFTFPGTVLLFGFFAYVYARAWISAIRYQNPYAILVFALLTQGAFFIPANNQLLHSPGGLFTTALVFVLYFVFGSRRGSLSRSPGRSSHRQMGIS